MLESDGYGQRENRVEDGRHNKAKLGHGKTTTARRRVKQSAGKCKVKEKHDWASTEESGIEIQAMDEEETWGPAEEGWESVRVV